MSLDGYEEAEVVYPGVSGVRLPTWWHGVIAAVGQATRLAVVVVMLSLSIGTECQTKTRFCVRPTGPVWTP